MVIRVIQHRWLRIRSTSEKNQDNWFLNRPLFHNSGLLFFTPATEFPCSFQHSAKNSRNTAAFAVDGRFGRCAQSDKPRQHAWRRQSRQIAEVKGVRRCVFLNWQRNTLLRISVIIPTAGRCGADCGF